MIQPKTMLLILGAIVFSVIGQLFLKSGAQHVAGVGRAEFLISALQDAHVIMGLAALTASTLFWIYVLRVAPLSRTYGITSLTYVLTPLASAHIFGEQIRRIHAVGTVLIIIGIAFLLSGD